MRLSVFSFNEAGLTGAVLLLCLLTGTVWLQLRQLPFQNIMAAMFIVAGFAVLDGVLSKIILTDFPSQTALPLESSRFWTRTLTEALFVWVPGVLNSRLAGRWVAKRQFPSRYPGMVVIMVSGFLGTAWILFARNSPGLESHPGWLASAAWLAPEVALLQIFLTPWLISKKPVSTPRGVF